MSKRSNLMQRIKTEAYITGEADVRMLVCNRISRPAFDRAVNKGIELREEHLAVGKFPDLSNASARRRALKSIGIEAL
ncbi:MAG TPA: hypothetical protein EYP90_01600 [Chromatiaceae bacterium]|nr:hypothetical protein [Chromatiaceae bacterium]